ncbi:MAG TPA: tetratricopeptide repeat protein [Tepidisphaeraceae bacterium]|jgi:predicted O-linked N-acetylglucosamine transferase (SPINDLY family)|nr:tetratricopeptide repeat protein [Tepidisphaeraceae bacterium]
MTLDEAFQLAASHQQAGRYSEAEPLYHQILAAKSDHFDSLYLLGLLYIQTNRLHQGIPILERVASAAEVNAPAVFLNLAAAHRLTHRVDRAIPVYHRLLSLHPGHVDGWSLLASALVETGRLDDAMVAWQNLLRIAPNHAESWSNLAVTLERLGRLSEAEQSCRRAIELNPQYAQAHNNLGAILAAQGRLDDALAAHYAAIAANPNFARAYVNLSHTALLAGQINNAVIAAQRAVQLTPNDADAQRNLAAALNDKGDVAGAGAAYSAAIGLLNPLVHSESPAPGVKEIWTRLHLCSAVLLPQVYTSVDEINHWRSRLIENLADLQKNRLQADLTTEPVPTLFSLAYHGQDDRAIAQSFASLMSPPASATDHRSQTTDRIHIAFISRFFRDHTIGLLNLGLVQHLDRSRFHVTVFSVGDHPGQTSHAFRQAADQYIVLPPQLSAAREIISRQSCDILFYTDLGMDPATYSLAFSRLAHVQCTTWGHPVTTGIPAIDYFLSADALELPGSESQYTETLIKFPQLSVYYHRPILTTPRPRAHFNLDDSWTIYGCLQMLWKFHPDFDPLLAGVLRGDPKGRLLLLQGLNPDWDQQLLSRFKQSMPDVADRILFLPRLSRPDFLSLTSLCDVMLDPIHFCGGNTSYEALAFNVPVITLPSAYLRGRLTHALYQQINYSSCTAISREDYITRAITIATDPATRHQVRADLATLTPSLYENAQAVRELESFFIRAVKVTAPSPSSSPRLGL